MASSPADSPPGAVARNWPIGSVHATREITAGAVNRVIEISAASGAYFLRTYRTGSALLLRREHRVIAHVRDAGLPAVAPVPTAAGATYVEAAGRFHALYPAAAGRQLDGAELRLEHAASAGETLGRLHLALASLPAEGLPAPRLAWDASDWLRRLTVIEAAILAIPAPDALDETALRRVRTQSAWLADPACPHSHELGMRQPIHGDFHQGNLFFAQAEVSGIIDWEQGASMPRAYEAVRAATYMFDLTEAPTQAFLAAWQAATGATVGELDAGAAAFALVRDHWVWALEEVYVSANARARRYIPASPFEPFWRRWLAFRKRARRSEAPTAPARP